MDKKPVMTLLAGIGAVTATVIATRRLNKFLDEIDETEFEGDDDGTDWPETVKERVKDLEAQVEKLQKQREELLYAVYVELPNMYKNSEAKAVAEALERAKEQPANSTEEKVEAAPEEDKKADREDEFPGFPCFGEICEPLQEPEPEKTPAKLKPTAKKTTATKKNTKSE